MLLLAAISLGIFALGYWSASARINQLGVNALSRQDKVIFAAVGIFCAAAAALFFAQPIGLCILLAEFFTLCAGQSVGYIFGGRTRA